MFNEEEDDLKVDDQGEIIGDDETSESDTTGDNDVDPDEEALEDEGDSTDENEEEAPSDTVPKADFDRTVQQGRDKDSHIGVVQGENLALRRQIASLTGPGPEKRKAMTFDELSENPEEALSSRFVSREDLAPVIHTIRNLTAEVIETRSTNERLMFFQDNPDAKGLEREISSVAQERPGVIRGLRTVSERLEYCLDIARSRNGEKKPPARKVPESRKRRAKTAGGAKTRSKNPAGKFKRGEILPDKVSQKMSVEQLEGHYGHSDEDD